MEMKKLKINNSLSELNTEITKNDFWLKNSMTHKYNKIQ